jgi:uncharacterized protein YqeY
MPLKDRITDDMKDAMRAKAASRLSTIRLLLAAIKQREVDERKTLSDADVVAVIDRMVKQRAEIVILEGYLPQRMSDAEIDAAVERAIAEAQAAGASGPALMGKVMAALKPQLSGRADMAQVSAKVKARL